MVRVSSASFSQNPSFGSEGKKKQIWYWRAWGGKKKNAGLWLSCVMWRLMRLKPALNKSLIALLFFLSLLHPFMLFTSAGVTVWSPHCAVYFDWKLSSTEELCKIFETVDKQILHSPSYGIKYVKLLRLRRNSVRLAIRKVMYAPSKQGEQPYMEVSKDFMMCPNKLHLEVSLDKEVSVLTCFFYVFFFFLVYNFSSLVLLLFLFQMM